MYRLLRVIHRWVGLFACLFLATIAVTGFLLATKGSLGWIRPPEREGETLTSLSNTIGLDQAGNAALSLGIANLASHKDIDRMDYRPGKNIYKILSKKGYHEVQVCGTTGKVLQIAKRNDQFTEDIHDLSYFSDTLHRFVLPAIAFSLLYLSISGATMFFIPVIRRIKFRRSHS